MPRLNPTQTSKVKSKNEIKLANSQYFLLFIVQNSMQFEVQAETSEWLRVRTQLK